MKYATVAVLLVTPALALNGGYLNSMSGGSAMKASSYMPTKYNVPKAGPSSYLDQVAGQDDDMSNEPVMVAIGKLHDNMNNYQRQTIDVLKDINVAVGELVSKAEARKTDGYVLPTRVPETTELVSALEASGSSASYLNQMGRAATTIGSPVVVSSYAPTKSNVSQKSGGAGFGSYLDSF